MSKIVQFKGGAGNNGSFAENLSRSIPSEVLGPYIAVDQAIFAARESDIHAARIVLYVATVLCVLLLFWLYKQIYSKGGPWLLSAVIATTNFCIWTYVAGHVWHFGTPNPIYAAGVAFLSTIIPLFLTGAQNTPPPPPGP